MFNNFDFSWFLTTPGLLTGVGCLLILISIIIFLSSMKGNKKEVDENLNTNLNTTTTTAIPETNFTANTGVAPIDFAKTMEPAPLDVSLDQNGVSNVNSNEVVNNISEMDKLQTIPVNPEQVNYEPQVPVEPTVAPINMEPQINQVPSAPISVEPQVQPAPINIEPQINQVPPTPISVEPQIQPAPINIEPQINQVPPVPISIEPQIQNPNPAINQSSEIKRPDDIEAL